MKIIYIPFWFKSGDVRGECYQRISIGDDGKHAATDYVDDAGQPFELPEPHEGVLINPRAPLDRPPNMPVSEPVAPQHVGRTTPPPRPPHFPALPDAE
jgi:hypothetical protein